MSGKNNCESYKFQNKINQIIFSVPQAENCLTVKNRMVKKVVLAPLKKIQATAKNGFNEQI